MHTDPSDNTVVDPQTGDSYDYEEVGSYEFGEQWLNRDPDQADVSLADYDNACCQERYGENDAGSSDDY